MELIILLRLCTVLTLMSFALINFTLSAPIRYKHNNTKTAYENHNEKTIEKQHEAPAVKDCCRHESCHTGLKDTADALLPVLPIQANKGGLQRRRDRSPLVRGKTTKLRTVRQRTTRRRKRPSSRDAETSVVTKTSSTVVMSSSPSSPSSSDADVDNDNYLLSPDTENWESTTVTVAKAAATKAVTENPWTGCSDEEILSNYIKTVGFALPSNDNDEDEWTTESRERSHDVEPRQTT